MASVVVFLVALPLCIGLALASGTPIASGLISGIVGGIVTGALAGAPVQVSGPANGATVIVFDIVQNRGLAMLGLAVLVAGALQIVAGALRLGQWFRAVSPAEVKGMLAGIGVLIFSSQFHVMVDHKPRSDGFANLVTLPSAVWKSFRIPRLPSTEERAYRSDALHLMSEVTHQQASLRAQIAELIP